MAVSLQASVLIEKISVTKKTVGLKSSENLSCGDKSDLSKNSFPDYTSSPRSVDSAAFNALGDGWPDNSLEEYTKVHSDAREITETFSSTPLQHVDVLVKKRLRISDIPKYDNSQSYDGSLGIPLEDVIVSSGDVNSNLIVVNDKPIEFDFSEYIDANLMASVISVPRNAFTDEVKASASVFIHSNGVLIDDSLNNNSLIDELQNNSFQFEVPTNITPQLDILQLTESHIDDPPITDPQIDSFQPDNLPIDQFNTYEDDIYSEFSEDELENDPDYTPSLSATCSTNASKNMSSSLNEIVGSPRSGLPVDVRVVKVPASKENGTIQTKKSYSLYYKSLITKLPRHLGNKHYNEEAVKEILNLLKGNSRRKELLTNLRNKGNFEHSTNIRYDLLIILMAINYVRDIMRYISTIIFELNYDCLAD